MASVRKRLWAEAGSKKADGRRSGVAWEVSWNDGGKRRKKSGFKTRGEAEAFAVARQQEVNDGLSRPEGHRLTLSQVAEEFMRQVSARVERKVIGPGHKINMEGHFRNYILRNKGTELLERSKGRKAHAFTGGLGHLPLSRIRPSTVEKFRDDLLHTGLSTQAVRAIIVTLHQALDFARRRDYVAFNAADRIKIEKPREEKSERVTPPGPDLVRKVLDAADGPVRLAIELSACTGIRAGELRALRYKHIDQEKGLLRIRVALNVQNKEGPPKSTAGYREIPLAPALLTNLELHRCNAVKQGPNALVFLPEAGWEFLPQSWLRHRLNKVLRSIGLNVAQEDGEDEEEDGTGDFSRRFTWHALRHYAISSWIAQGLGLKAVQTYAGHADVGTTWNRYGHLFPAEEHRVKITEASNLTLGLPVT